MQQHNVYLHQQTLLMWLGQELDSQISQLLQGQLTKNINGEPLYTHLDYAPSCIAFGLPLAAPVMQNQQF
jgi:hypothetical protein